MQQIPKKAQALTKKQEPYETIKKYGQANTSPRQL